MKTSSLKSSARKSKPVEVVITVSNFNDVLAVDTSPNCRDTDYTMKLRRKDPRADIKGDDLYIKHPGAPIRFTIASSAEDKEKYYAIGITFLREGQRSTGDNQRLGMLCFPQHDNRADGRALTILDTYKGDLKRVRYKFSMIIQRGSDGKIGIIDPGIEHYGDQ